jgi:CBS domain-containing protein
MAVGEICSRVVVFARRGETLREAARVMREHHVGALVVVEERGGVRVPVGMLTDRDIVVAAVAKGLDADGLRVEEVMTTDLATAAETDGVSDCIARMRARGVRRMPVVDGRGGLVGIVTADDFLDLLAEELSALARMVVSEQRREAKTRSI